MKPSSQVPHRNPASPRRKSLARIAALALAASQPGLSVAFSAAFSAALPGLLLGVASGASAQSLRMIPDDARYGEFELVSYPEARIDGQAMRLGAGAQIRDARNMIVLPSTVSGKHPALYRLDPTGQLVRVWLLAPDEVEAAKARPTGR